MLSPTTPPYILHWPSLVLLPGPRGSKIHDLSQIWRNLDILYERQRNISHSGHTQVGVDHEFAQHSMESKRSEVVRTEW